MIEQTVNIIQYRSNDPIKWKREREESKDILLSSVSESKKRKNDVFATSSRVSFNSVMRLTRLHHSSRVRYIYIYIFKSFLNQIHFEDNKPRQAVWNVCQDYLPRLIYSDYDNCIIKISSHTVNLNVII